MSNRVDALAIRCDALEKLYGAQLLWKIDNYMQKFNEAKAGSKTTIFRCSSICLSIYLSVCLSACLSLISIYRFYLSICSPPFLTGRHGYKMALSACLFGDGKGTVNYKIRSVKS